MRRLVFPAILLATGYAARPASADFIVTFEAAPIGVYYSSYTESGVTFTSVGGGKTLFSGLTPNGSLGVADGASPKYELRADIVGFADMVSVDLGDFGGDNDRIFLEAFNASGQSLGFASRALGQDFVGMRSLTVSAPGIAYAIFGARSPSTNGSSVYADNFSYHAIPVPEPASILQATVGGIGFITFARRRRRGG